MPSENTTVKLLFSIALSKRLQATPRFLLVRKALDYQYSRATKIDCRGALNGAKHLQPGPYYSEKCVTGSPSG